MSCVVYKGLRQQQKERETATAQDSGESVLIKLYSDVGKFQNGKTALEILAEVEGALNVVCAPALRNQPPTPVPSIHDTALVVSPVGWPMATVNAAHRGGPTVNGLHLQQLVEILRQAHHLGIVHRDIKPDNIYFWGMGKTKKLLNDWASSVESGVSAERVVEGTHGYSVMPDESGYDDWETNKARDLVALVRTSYTLLFYEIPGNWKGRLVEEFWEQRFRQGKVWERALQHAREESYQALSEALGQIK